MCGPRTSVRLTPNWPPISAAGEVGPGLLPVPGEEAADPSDGGVEVIDAREGEDPEVIGVGPAEPCSLHDLDLLAQQQVKDELLVVVDGVHGGVQPGEGVQGAFRLDAGNAGDLVESLPGMIALFVQAPAGQYQVGDALPAAQRGLDGVLAGDIGAQPGPGQGGQSLDVVSRVLLGAGDDEPSGTEPGDPVGLGQAAEGQAEHVRGQRRRAVVDGIVIEDLVVDLVREHQQVVAAGEIENAFQQCPRVDSAGGVVRVDDHDRAGPVGDLRRHVGEVREPVSALVAQGMHRPAAGQAGDGGPQRVVRSRDQYLVAVLEQGLDGHRDEFGDPVAEEYVVYAHIGKAQILVALDDRAAGRQDAAGIAVTVRVGQVPDNVLQDLLGGLEAEQGGVPGVQPEHAVASLFQLVRVLDHRPADLIADPGELAGLSELHGQWPPRPGSVAVARRYLVPPSYYLDVPTVSYNYEHAATKLRPVLPPRPRPGRSRGTLDHADRPGTAGRPAPVHRPACRPAGSQHRCARLTAEGDGKRRPGPPPPAGPAGGGCRLRAHPPWPEPAARADGAGRLGRRGPCAAAAHRCPAGTLVRHPPDAPDRRTGGSLRGGRGGTARRGHLSYPPQRFQARLCPRPG